ncbi:ice-binding family protein [Janthinobacterium sp.]|uniref:ice-binding family protein n=1 Tax=Janthinobacterium sp. TaxID=1871054 RepID=UPI00293D904C|nr:ice-binding family protein [Janthinobacterium sp.]
MKTLFFSVGFLLAAMLAGCGGGDQGRDPILGLPAAELTSVTVTPATASVPLGASQQFTATANYADGASKDVTASSTWSTDNAGIAGVNAGSGLATGVAQGAAHIGATFGGKSDTRTLTVTAVAAVSLAVTPVNAAVPIDGLRQFTATATYSDGTSSDVTASSAWNSASTNVATVLQNGVATGVTTGTAVVTATFAGKSNSQTLTVGSATLTSIAVTPSNAVIPVGDTQQFIATASYSDGSTGIVTASSNWSSANLAVATVNTRSGVATGRSAGAALITATYKGKNDAKTLTVNPALGPQAVILGDAGYFAILTKTGITDVPSSAITGNIGTSPISGAFIGITCPEVSGIIYAADAAGPACAVADPVLLTAAISDMETAYTDAAGRPAGVGPFLNVGAGTVANQTLAAGTYTWGSNVTIPTNLTLNGGANDVWIFQITGKLNISPNMRVILTGGAQAKNIFWQVTGVVTLDTHSHFEGTILAQTNVAMLTGASLNGRSLAQTATTLQQNTVNKPAP